MVGELLEAVAVLVVGKPRRVAEAGVGHLDDRLRLPAVGRGEGGEQPLGGLEAGHRVEAEGARALHAPGQLAGEAVEGLRAAAVLDRDLAQRLELGAAGEDGAR